MNTNIFFEDILNGMNSDVVVLSPEFKYIYINKAAIKDSITREWLLGKDDFDFFKARNLDLSRAEQRLHHLELVKKTKAPVQFEEATNLSNGKKEIKLRNYHPIIDGDGNITMIIGYGFNISKIKETESELELAREKAENLVKSQEDFLAKISHDLRTPLNAIQGIVEMLSEFKFNEKEMALFKILKTNSDHLLDLVHELLTHARINNSINSLSLEEVKIKPFLEEITDTFRLETNSQSVNFNRQVLMEDSLFLSVDKLKLTQIINNLITNAIKFTQKGTVSFYAEYFPDTPRYGSLKIRIEDTGIGIPDEFIEQIFDPYSQIDSKINLKKGIGLGLSITKKLVDLHHGRIIISSKLGEGSVFSVYIPCKQIIPKPTILPDTESLNIKSSQILIVEDHPVNRFLLHNQLDDKKHTLVDAEDGESALNLCRKYQFDLILLDFNLPDISGEELLHHIKNLPNYNAIPVIAITANAFQETRQKALEIGFSEFISKPYRKDELIQKIQQVLS
jgi:signal transduction histidine kinase/CheY-like chemotaxis protein